MQWPWRDSNLRPLCLKSSILPLSHCAPRGGPMVFRKTIISQGSRGGPTSLRGGVQLFPGGPNAYLHRNLTKLGFARQGVPIPFWIRSCSAFTCSLDPVIDLHMKFVFELGGTGQSFLKVSKVAKIRNRYNQVPHLTQDTNGKVTNSQKTPQTRAKRSALSQQVTTKHI